MAGNIDKLIINSPHEEPQHYWFYNRENRDFHIRDGRLPAGYVMVTPNSKAFNDLIKAYMDYINVPKRFGSGTTTSPNLHNVVFVWMICSNGWKGDNLS